MSTEMVPVSQLHELQAQLEIIKNKNLAKLGDGSMFWIEEAGEMKRGFKAKIDLSFPDQFCLIPAGGKETPMICAAGYDKANQYAGVEVIRPKTVTIEGGKEVGNPYFEKDGNGALLSIFIRGIGIGYAPTGGLAIVDQTVFVNLNTLLVQEVQSKLKHNPTIATLGIQSEKPKSFEAHITKWDNQARKKVLVGKETVECSGAWYFLPVHGGMGYWVDLSHPDTQSAFESFTQKQRFLERTATTVLKRLILSSHPAIAAKRPIVTSTEKGREKAHIFVYGFRAEAGDAKKKREDLEALAAKLAAGESAANADIIKHDAADITEDADILQAEALTDADPSEIPVSDIPAGFEDETESFEPDRADYYDRQQDETDGGIPTKAGGTHERKAAEAAKKPAETSNAVPAIKQLNAVLADAKLQQACIAVKKEMSVNFAELRKAPEDIILSFIARVKEVAA